MVPTDHMSIPVL